MLSSFSSRKKCLPGAAVLTAVVLLIGWGMALGVAPSPARPTGDDLVLARVPPAAHDPRARELRALERRATGDLASAVRLARLELAEARRTGDPRPLGYAEAALGPWWTAATAPAPVLLLRATIRQARHDFAGALADLDRLILLAPGDPQAWLTRAVVLTVRGRYGEARASCDRLRALASPLVVRACQAPIDGLTGRTGPARRSLDEALAAATPDERLWATSLRGELSLWRGDLAGAEAALVQVVRGDPDDRYTRALYADLLLDGGRPAEAAALVAGREQDDGLLLRRVLAETALGGGQAATLAAMLRERFAGNIRRGDAIHQREQARFALAVDRDPPRALALARAGWSLQHEPWDARLLMEAALAAGRPAEAAPVLAWLRDSGFEDPRLRRLAAALGGGR
jgi:uncharacterized protein (TIGR02996 family)